MSRLTYQEIQKDLDALYVEHQNNNFTVDQHIGRCLYEYEQVIDPEEEREIESFLFYVAIAKQLMGISQSVKLDAILPQAIKFIFDFDERIFNGDDEALKILSDYKEVVDFYS